MSELLSGLNGGNVPALDLIILLTAVALLPSIVIMMTSFLRIVIVLSFTRNAIGVQQTPPNVVLTGISLFLTLYIMAPVISDINTNAPQAGHILDNDCRYISGFNLCNHAVKIWSVKSYTRNAVINKEYRICKAVIRSVFC